MWFRMAFWGVDDNRSDGGVRLDPLEPLGSDVLGHLRRFQALTIRFIAAGDL